MKTLHTHITQKLACAFLCVVSILCSSISFSQDCPPNIDFESGTFAGWTCYTGSTSAIGGQNQIILNQVSGPVYNRHTMIAANTAGLDPYGGFPRICPNGSGHSIQLGNNVGGGQAEGISYEFTIPANRNVYSLIYHYAVVFQDPNHEIYQQPRMVVEVTNVTDGTTIDCSSFYFVPYGSILPGFFESPNAGDVPVWCKDWSAVTINLNNMAGKTIKLFFKTADCTFQRHFGYAYIDVNSECSDEFVGAKYCPDDTAVNVIAPYGYQTYTWYNSNFSQVIGNQQTISFRPPPPVGTMIAVEVVPYSGYGCLDTLYARLLNTLDVKANAGPDQFSCNNTPIQIGSPPKQGFIYSWSPPATLSNAGVSNPFAAPDTTTTYILTSQHDGGGCLSTDTVVVRTPKFTDSLQLLGKAAYCVGYGDSAILRVDPADSIQWFKDGAVIPGATQPRLRVLQSGTYYAVLFSSERCQAKTKPQTVLIESARPGIRYPLQYAVANLPLGLRARQFGDSVLWTPGIFLDKRDTYTPDFRGNRDQEYNIQIITAAGCITVDTQLVKIGKGVEIYVPTAFTPNSDRLNDVLRPTLMGIRELKSFRVYNRWGQLIFETKTQFQGWDGKINGIPQATDVFVWIAEAIGSDGATITRKGTSLLIR